MNYTHSLDSVLSLQRGFNPDGGDFFGFVLPATARNIEVTEAAPYLNLTALKPYYYPTLERKYAPRTLYTPPVIERVAQSAADLPWGVLYQHPDGSLLAGAYLRDQLGRPTTLSVEFDLPPSTLDRLRFYPQPALNDPTLSFGQNVALAADPTVRKVAGDYLDAGVTLKIN